jgi:hypothetical protein
MLGQTPVQGRVAYLGQAQQLADIGSLLRGEAQRVSASRSGWAF